MKKIEDILLELKKYSDPLFKSFEGVKDDLIILLESRIGYSISKDFKEFLRFTNGAVVLYEDIYGIHEDNKPFDLYEHYLIEKNEVGNPIREHYLPIYPDGMGNHNCLDLKSLSPDGEKCTVIFWQHDRVYSDIEQPDIDADSFTEFLGKLLKEISENYNYDGTEKKIL